MATLDTSALSEEAHLVVAVILAKLVLFAVVLAATFITSLRPTFRRPGSLQFREEGSDAEPQEGPESPRVGGAQTNADKRAWMRRAGLYAIFATQSNDFALGLPLIEAIWGKRFSPVIFIVGCAQLAFLNPLAFALMEMGNMKDDKGDRQRLLAGASRGGAAGGGAEEVAGSGGTHGAGGGAAAMLVNRRSSLTTRCGKACVKVLCCRGWPRGMKGFVKVVRKVIRSPVVIACFLGLTLRGVFIACNAELPAVVYETLKALADTFTGCALITLGLSLRMRPAVLRGKSVVAVCLLTSKFLLCPLLMRLFADILIKHKHRQPPHEASSTEVAALYSGRRNGADDDMDDGEAFAFVYGMLPSAPTVVVFAREYGERSSFLATLQLLCLVVTVPFLLTATVAIESPTGTEPTALISLVYSIAILGMIASIIFLATFATAAFNKGKKMLTILPLCWLPGLSMTALALCTMEAFGHGVGACSDRRDATTDATQRAVSSWLLHCLRFQLAMLALVMAHQAHPERFRVSTTKLGAQRLLHWQLAGAVLAVLVPGAVEFFEWMRDAAAIYPPHAPPPPAAPPHMSHMITDYYWTADTNPGKQICGGESSRTVQIVHMAMDLGVAIFILVALSIMLMAPSSEEDNPGPTIRGEMECSPTIQAAEGEASSSQPLNSERRYWHDLPGELRDGAERDGLSLASASAMGHGGLSNVGGRRRGGIQAADSLESLPSFDRGPSYGGALDRLDNPFLQHGQRAGASNPREWQVMARHGHKTTATAAATDAGTAALPTIEGSPLIEATASGYSPTIQVTPGTVEATGVQAVNQRRAGGMMRPASTNSMSTLDRLHTPSSVERQIMANSRQQSRGQAPELDRLHTLSSVERQMMSANNGGERQAGGGGNGGERHGGGGAERPTANMRDRTPSMAMLDRLNSPSTIERVMMTAPGHVRERLIASARRVLQTSQAPAPGPQPRPGSINWQPLLVRWRTRLCLLQLYAALSMLLSVTTVSTFLQEADVAADGIQGVVRLADRICIYAHAIVITALFGLTDEIIEPLWSRVRTCLAAALVGDAQGEITAFPQSASGFWG